MSTPTIPVPLSWNGSGAQTKTCACVRDRDSRQRGFIVRIDNDMPKSDTRGRVLRGGIVVGAAACVTALVSACTPVASEQPQAATASQVAAVAESASPSPAASPSPSETAAEVPTIPFDAGYVPFYWSKDWGFSCGMPAADLVSQDDRFRLEITGPMVTATDGRAFPVRLEHELADDATLVIGTGVEFVWTQAGVAVDLDYGWNEGGGPSLYEPDAQGLPSEQVAAWQTDPADAALRRTSGLATVSPSTTCLPDTDVTDDFTTYSTARPDGEYEVRAAIAVRVGDGPNYLIFSDPVPLQWEGGAS